MSERGVILLLVFVALVGWANAFYYAALYRRAHDLVILVQSYTKGSAWAKSFPQMYELFQRAARVAKGERP